MKKIKGRKTKTKLKKSGKKKETKTNSNVNKNNIKINVSLPKGNDLNSRSQTQPLLLYAPPQSPFIQHEHKNEIKHVGIKEEPPPIVKNNVNMPIFSETPVENDLKEGPQFSSSSMKTPLKKVSIKKSIKKPIKLKKKEDFNFSSPTPIPDPDDEFFSPLPKAGLFSEEKNNTNLSVVKQGVKRKDDPLYMINPYTNSYILKEGPTTKKLKNSGHIN